MEDKEYIKRKIESQFFSEKRKSLSLRFPFLVPYILFYRKWERFLKDFGIIKASSYKNLNKDCLKDFYVLHRHSSPLLRKLGDDKSHDVLQKSKIKNLEIASKKVNGLCIKPGETFSFWGALGGSPTKRKGYQDGILLSAGKVVPGIGGGLCQMSNLLYWLILHTDLEVVERHHHSLDVFKDSGRTVPFGVGATVFFPVLDLRFKNTYNHPIIITMEVTDTQLVGKFLIEEKESLYKYHLYDKDSQYYNYKDTFFRYNKVFREKIVYGSVVDTEFLYENIFPTLYVPDTYVQL